MVTIQQLNDQSLLLSPFFFFFFSFLLFFFVIPTAPKSIATKAEGNGDFAILLRYLRGGVTTHSTMRLIATLTVLYVYDTCDQLPIQQEERDRKVGEK